LGTLLDFFGSFVTINLKVYPVGAGQSTSHFYGWRTSKTSFTREGWAQTVAFGTEEAAAFCLRELRRAEDGAPSVQAVRKEINPINGI